MFVHIHNLYEPHKGHNSYIYISLWVQNLAIYIVFMSRRRQKITICVTFDDGNTNVCMICISKDAHIVYLNLNPQ